MKLTESFHYIFKFLSIAVFTTLLMACGSSGEFEDLNAKLDEIRAKPKGRIPPPPEFKAFEIFTYQAAGLRSPFEIPVEVVLETKVRTGPSVKPDLQRRKEKCFR